MASETRPAPASISAKGTNGPAKVKSVGRFDRGARSAENVSHAQGYASASMDIAGPSVGVRVVGRFDLVPAGGILRRLLNADIHAVHPYPSHGAIGRHRHARPAERGPAPVARRPDRR